MSKDPPGNVTELRPASKTNPGEAEGLPLTSFVCHLTDKAKAKRYLRHLHKTMDVDEETMRAIQQLPIVVGKGAKKNRLIAMSGTTPCFSVNLKTGDAVHY